MKIAAKTLNGTMPTEFLKPIMDLQTVVDGNENYEVTLIIREKCIPKRKGQTRIGLYLTPPYPGNEPFRTLMVCIQSDERIIFQGIQE